VTRTDRHSVQFGLKMWLFKCDYSLDAAESLSMWTF